MANVKVKFRKSTVEGKQGTVYYQICHAGSHINVSTRLRVGNDGWDEITGRITETCGECNAERYNNIINADVNLITSIISEFEDSLQKYTVRDVADRFRESSRNITVAEYMHKRIHQLEGSGHYSTAMNYRSALNSFIRFMGCGNVSMSVFNQGVVFRYSHWLSENHVSRNSISFYMRVLRAVYNSAVHEKILIQTHPFADVYTGVDHTRKRALSEDTLRLLFALQLDDFRLRLVRDMFLFSYCTRGMAFVDMAFLKKDNIRGDNLVYRRRKTSQTISVRVEPCIRSIIERYEWQTAETPYVFPIITAHSEREAYRQYRHAIVNYNRSLKLLARMAGISENLSSYTSRHSWATAARNHNIPISVISAGMGHSSQQTTEIYLASIENSVIDDANQSLLQDIDKYVL